VAAIASSAGITYITKDAFAVAQLGMAPADKWQAFGALVAIVFVSFSMVYDLQLIFGGENREHQYSVDDYCLAAIQVYLSIIILILRIMEILARLRQR
jgi:FtsH-binding integral membrane protein